MMSNDFNFKLLTYLTITLLVVSCGIYESSPLIVSIRSEDAYSVRSLIDSGEDVNAMSQDLIGNQYWKLTPLIRASISGNLEIMQMLINAGADVNGIDEWGDTPLMAAAAFGHVEAAKLLISSGANLDAKKPDETTALMIAARRGNYEVLKTLITAGADPNIGLGTGDTALSLAAGAGNVVMVKLLLANGASVDRVAIERAKQNHYLTKIELLELFGERK